MNINRLAATAFLANQEISALNGLLSNEVIGLAPS